jgi:hypothetical protein
VEVLDAITRDIDQIIAAVRQQIPEVIVWQLQKTHPADDNGIWYFGLPEASNDVQLENSSGMAHFWSKPMSKAAIRLVRRIRSRKPCR